MTAPKRAGVAARGERRARRPAIRSLCMNHSRLSTQPLACSIQITWRRNAPKAQAPRGPAAALRPKGMEDPPSRPRAPPPRVSPDCPCCAIWSGTLTTRPDYPAPGRGHEEQARSYPAACVRWINPQHRPRAPRLRQQPARPEYWHGRGPMDWSLPDHVRPGDVGEAELRLPPALYHVPAECLLPLKTM